MRLFGYYIGTLRKTVCFFGLCAVILIEIQIFLFKSLGGLVPIVIGIKCL